MPYCKALYNHLYVDVQGFYAPCCFYKERQKYHYSNLSWKEFYDSAYMQNIRKNMEDGWDAGCNHCEQLELQNLTSYRNVVDVYCKSDKPKIEYIELSCNNSCNIRCRMCKADSSSKWADTLNIQVIKIENFSKFLEDIDTQNLKVIKYLGGEPFITPEIKILFEWMQTLPNKIKFYCNTNLTLFPNKYVDILKTFDKNIVGYSIDGIGSVNNYIRQDSNWNNVLKNLQLWEELKKECELYTYVHTTVQAYNYHDIKNIQELCSEYDLHHSDFKIFSPKEFTLDALPTGYVKKYLNSSNEKYLNNYNYNHELFNKLKETTYKQDLLLKNNLQDCIPELAEWI